MPVTWPDIEAVFASPPSPLETPGKVYLYRHRDLSSPAAIAAGRHHLKFGRTNDIERREGEWERQCAPLAHHWLWAYDTDTPRRLGGFLSPSRACGTLTIAERLVHLHLRWFDAASQRYTCPGLRCGCRHQENFDENCLGDEGSVRTVVEYWLGRLKQPIVFHDL